MTKYYLEFRDFGKFSYWVPKACTPKKLKELQESGEPIYDSKGEAKKEALKKKK